MIDTNRKIMLVDTETTNSMDDPLVYDFGFQIFDLDGKTYERKSLVNSDVFLDKSLMECAYYADKIPAYNADLLSGSRVMMRWQFIKKMVREMCRDYGVKYVVAHNARFDYRAINTTQRYLTSSKWRYFFPYGVEWWDTLRMAREILTKNPAYEAFCDANDYYTASGQMRLTAEIIYRFLSGNNDFEERHTGFEDTEIERKIFEYCVSQKPDIDGTLWRNAEPTYQQWLAFNFYSSPQK